MSQKILVRIFIEAEKIKEKQVVSLKLLWIVLNANIDKITNLLCNIDIKLSVWWIY